MLRNDALLRSASAAALLVAALLAAAPRPAVAATEDAQSYVDQAKAKIAAGDLREAEIQLRNAVRANPTDPNLHIELADLYIKLGNYPAAEAEAHVAQLNKGDDAKIAPIMAQALLRQGKMQQLLQQIQPGARVPDSAESIVRLALGDAHLAFGEDDQAQPLLYDAERLDDAALGPKLAITSLLARQGKLDAAQAELARAKAVAPDSIDVLRAEGLLLSAKGERDAAIAKFTELLTKYPNDLLTRANRANLYMNENDLKDAQQDITDALKLAPKNPRAIYLDALLLAKKGDLKKADEALSEISAGFGSFPTGYFLQGSIKYALGQLEQADASLSKYSARNPHEPTSRRLLAMIALKQHNPAHAIELLQPVVDANPGDKASVNILAQAYLQTGKRNQAVELYQKAAETHPDDANDQTRAALAQVRFGDATEGLSTLEKIANSTQGEAAAGPVLAMTDLQMGRIAKAAETVNALVKLNPKDPVAQNLLGLVHMAQADYEGAAKIFGDLVKTDSNLLQPQRNLARAYTDMGDSEAAAKVWKTVLQRQPNDVAALSALARIAVGAKDLGGAEDLLKRAQQASPKNPSPGIELLQVYALQKDWDKAKLAGRTLEGQFPGDPRVIGAVAILLGESGDGAGAVKEYARLTEAYPKSDAIWQRYASFQLRQGDNKGARDSLMKALALAPWDAASMQGVVNIDLATDGLDRALATAHSFADRQPIAAAMISADLLVRAKRGGDAVALLTEAQAKTPATPIVVRLAETTWGVGKQEAALSLLDDWLKSHHDAVDTVPTRLALANLYLVAHQDDKARALYEAVLQDAPTNIVTLNNLAAIYEKMHDPRAHDLAAQAFDLAPSPATADTYGWQLVNGGGDAKIGLRLITLAGNAVPGNPTIQYHLAAALNATGDKDKARTVLEQALKSDATFDGRGDAQKLLTELQHG